MKEKTAYIDCSSGVAGDMLIASCIDAGVDQRQLERLLHRGLKIKGWRFEVREVQRGHAKAKTLTVHGSRPFGSPGRMLAALKRGSFPETAKKSGIAILESIIAAESKVHGVRRQEVHFHELNSIDTLVDIMGACTAFSLLGIGRVCSSPVNLGQAAPATLELAKAKGIPVFSDQGRYERATPTGTAIVGALSGSFGGMPLMTLEKTGAGAGTRDIPNAGMLRIIVGVSPLTGAPAPEMDEAILLETNIDDMDPRVYPYIMEQLLAAGVKDVWLTQVLMKKGRPGVLLSVLCDARQEQAAIQLIFREATTLGIRRLACPRYVLPRKMKGNRKVAELPGGKTKIAEEFEIVKRQAIATGTPLKDLL